MHTWPVQTYEIPSSVWENRGEQQPRLEQAKLVFAPVKRGLPCLNRGYRTPDPSPSPVSKCLGLPVAHIWQDIWPKYIPFGFNFLSVIFAMGCYDVLWGWVGPFFALPMACDRITMVLEVSMQEQS